ncbi:hypothetical protein DFQ11_10119 [Winogradskyella epiphytica]|uniref:Tetratricopeptide repeat protein n=1 Tax=Winogradskyella epiphytica TaxID=262005 RepID=A0A2V4Y194_9FLAO|nr:hypothetical protein [Winogradskyella epiphytica]PYE82594.1 hypothetical protein DFQ11_10119 [Winogradskyella epiphytica]GGW72126.1 hypothetical protein GCM10008085_25370 [Winogradskyella epiphytica]
MQIQDLTYLLKRPEAVTASQLDELSSAIKEYPYFQPLRALHLKGLKQKESYKYNNALKVTAAHTTDRSVLFDYITSAVFNQNEISEQIKKNLEDIKALEVHEVKDISVNKRVELDDALKEQIKATEGVLDPDLFEAVPIPDSKSESNNSNIGDSIISVDVENITPEEQLNIGKPLDFDKSENHSFSEWLKITSFKPIVRDKVEVETESEVENEGKNQIEAKTESNVETKSINEDSKQEISSPLQEKFAIIDKFISENPKIKPVTSSAPKPKLVNNDDPVSDSLMTETLARIYLEQKNYDQAIQSYKILSLKYPEKSSFFAHQIKLVKELKDNNTL